MWCDQVYDHMWDGVKGKLRITLTAISKMPTCVCKDLLRISKIDILRVGIEWEQFGIFEYFGKM